MSRKGPKPLARLSAKSGKITISVEPSRKAPDACVVVAVPISVNHWVLDAAKCGGELLSGKKFDLTVVARAAFDAAHEKIMGTTAAMASHKASKMCCGSQGDHFLISVVCDKTFSAARKCAGTVIAAMKFGSLYPRYNAICRDLGVKPDRAAFEAAAKEANSAMMKGIQVIVTGRVNTKAEPVQKGAEMLAKKVRDGAPKSAGKARTLDIEEKVEQMYSHVNATGLEGIIVRNFVATKGNLKDLHLFAGRLYFPSARARLVGGLNTDSKIDPFAKALGKLGSEGVGLLVFQGAATCSVGTSALKVSGSLTESQVKSAIKKAI